MDIGQRLKIAREMIGYTQKKVSELTGIGESSISEFENNGCEGCNGFLGIYPEIAPGQVLNDWREIRYILPTRVLNRGDDRTIPE